MSPHKKKNGYTFISLLFSMTIFIMITPLLSSFIQLFSNMNSINSNEDYKVSTFFHLLQKELHSSTNVHVTTSSILLQQDDQTIIIEPYGNQIRRRVNYTGHEVMLFGVNTLQITEEQDTLYIMIETLEGETFERRFFLFAPLEE